MATLLREDPDFYPELVKLTACLADQLDKAPLPMCSVSLIPGDPDLTPVGPDGGIGWVRLTDVQAVSESGYLNCNPHLVASIEVGVVLCYPVNEDGSPLSTDQYLQSTRELLAAMAAQYRAIACCNWGPTGKQVSVEGWVSRGPSGGTITSVWALSLEL